MRDIFEIKRKRRLPFSAPTPDSFGGVAAFMLALMLFSGASMAAENSFAIKNLRSPKTGADYIAIAPAEFHQALRPLLEKRAAEGLRVALVSPKQIYDEFPRHIAGPVAIRAFMLYAYNNWESPKPKFLALVGDINIYEKFNPSAPVVPTFLVKVDTEGEAYTPSDAPFADMDSDDIPDIYYGRIPADAPQDVKTVVEKILDYENNTRPGPWRRTVSAFASTGNFGIFDKALEEITKQITKNNLDPSFDMNMTYGGSKLPYFQQPGDFKPRVMSRFNEGSLILSYIGHGHVTGLTKVCWNGECKKIFEEEDIKNVNSNGKYPFFFSVCCLTGKFNLERDSFAEQLLKSPGGPIGVFAAGEVSHPYSNAILSKDMLYFLTNRRPATIGEAISNLRRGLVKRMDDDRKFLDKRFALMSSKEEMERINYEHVFMYNFFGDPATKIPYAQENLEIAAPEKVLAGDTATVKIKSPAGKAAKLLVTLECEPVKVIHPIKNIDGLTGDELALTVTRNYENANNKVALKIETELSASGEAEVKIPISKDLPTGDYFIKAYAWDGAPDAMGRVSIKLENSSAPAYHETEITAEDTTSYARKKPEPDPMFVKLDETLKSGGKEAAIALIRSTKEFKKKHDDNPAVSAMIERIRLFNYIGEYGLADAAYAEAVKAHPKAWTAHDVAAESTASRRNKHLEAEAKKRKTQKYPPSWQSRRETAMDAEDLANKARAADLEKKAVAINPKCAECFMRLGEYSEKTGQFRDAEKAYQAAMNLDPKKTERVARLGRVKWKLGNESTARELLLKALELDPDSETASETLLSMTNIDFFYE